MKKKFIPRTGVPQKGTQVNKAIAIKESALRKIMITTGGMDRMNCFLPVISFNRSPQHFLRKLTNFSKDMD
jgi:hypothetical protein